MDGKSMDVTQSNIDALKQLFPEIVVEGKVDIEKLKLLLGDEVEDGEERYDFTWHGKRQAIKIAQTPSMGTLRPCKEESKDWDTTENLYIEGDNLEVLKLLQKSYFGKIKMIYIDPPYNTGNDFVYPDNYSDNIENYLAITGQLDDDDQKIGTNVESCGRFHTKWLNMMYPRLKLARNLLRDDGVIFISIDDNEVHNLRKLCDEMFGETNFIAQICHKSRASISNDKIISSNHNHILLYAKTIGIIFQMRNRIGLDPDLSGFDLRDEHGYYKLSPVDGPGGAKKGNPHYEFMGISGYWRFSKETMQQKYDQNLIVKRENSLQQKYYLNQAKESRKTDTTWWEDGGLTSNATKEFEKLMGGKYFDNPKSVELILRMLREYTYDDKEAIVLDFFSGSATTANAVMKLNDDDGACRKFILVQLQEECSVEDEATEAGYKNICEIGKERIRRAGEKIKIERDKQTGLNAFAGGGGTAVFGHWVQSVQTGLLQYQEVGCWC